MVIWEYQSRSSYAITIDDQMLNTMGNSGWELVSFNTSFGAFGKNAYEYIFKRPKEKK